MGYNNEFAVIGGCPWAVFDIETVPMPDCGEYLTDPIEAPSHYKDPGKIDAYKAEQRAKQIERAGLDLDLCEVAAIGWTARDSDSVYAQCRDTTEEAVMLDGFWRVVRNVYKEQGAIIGFNCLSFDLPILLRRSLYLGVPVPVVPVDKYRHDGVIDVADVLSFAGKVRMRSLGFYCQRFGIPYDDSVQGDQIAGLVAADEWEKVRSHVLNDVASTRALALRCGLMQAPVGAEAVAV